MLIKAQAESRIFAGLILMSDDLFPVLFKQLIQDIKTSINLNVAFESRRRNKSW